MPKKEVLFGWTLGLIFVALVFSYLLPEIVSLEYLVDVLQTAMGRFGLWDCVALILAAEIFYLVKSVLILHTPLS